MAVGAIILNSLVMEELNKKVSSVQRLEDEGEPHGFLGEECAKQ